MGELSELFELMHGAPESFRTLRARLRRWSEQEVRGRAFERYSERLERRQHGDTDFLMVSIGVEGERPATSEELTCLWVERPDRVRVEVEVEYLRTQVRNGGKLWVRMGEWGTIEQDVEGAEGEVGEHGAVLNPLGLAPGLEFELLGAGVVAGREGTRVRATPRESDEHFGFGLGAAGADEFELVVDRERGILLRSEARLRGEPFEIVEVAEVAFDEPLERGLFVYTPEPGEAVRSAAEMTEGWEHDLTLEQAAARAGFPLFVPAAVSPTTRLHVHYTRAREQPPIPESVSLLYHDEEELSRQFSLQEQAAEAGARADADPERVDLGEGVEAFVSAPAEKRRWMPMLVRLVREGTRIDLTSQELDRDELLAIARSLVRARAEPPRLS